MLNRQSQVGMRLSEVVRKLLTREGYVRGRLLSITPVAVFMSGADSRVAGGQWIACLHGPCGGALTLGVGTLGDYPETLADG